MDYSEFKAKQAEVNDAKQARLRVGISWLLHCFTVPPVVSLVYCIRTNNWVPFAAATGAAAVALPIAMVDFGITLAVAPPVTSAVLLQTKAQEKRRKLGIFGPEQADLKVFEAMA